MSNNKYKRIVVKVGTSSITYSNGKAKLRCIEELCKVLSDLNNSGLEIVLVSSGAISIGVGKLNLESRPKSTAERQAVAAVGQCELMFIYDKIFGEYNHTVAQILLTRDVVEREHSKNNVINTFNSIMKKGIIPIVNENDTVAVDELEGLNFGDNDMLSAIVSDLIGADLLVILSDINGLYDDDPHLNSHANKYDIITEIDEKMFSSAGDSGSNRGTGGMITKLHAAQFSMNRGITCCIMNGDDPWKLNDLIEGKLVGTKFMPKNA